VAETITRANFGLRVGKFELDFDDGEVRFQAVHILIGDERLLATCAQQGASGTISGIANVFPARLNRILETGRKDAAINELVDTILGYSVTPAVKSLVARGCSNPAWRTTRAPLLATSNVDHSVLADAYDKVTELDHHAGGAG